MYLVDTDVISALSPARAVPNKALAAWLDLNTDRLFLSVITVAEIEAGIAMAARRQALRKAELLSAWLESVLHLFGARVLAVDVCVARRLGVFMDGARAGGLAPGWSDLAIAATAESHRFTVLTRNVRHFRGLPVEVCDPFERVPG